MKQIQTLSFPAVWQWKKLFLVQAFVLFAFVSLLCPLWKGVDTAFFQFLNGSLAHSHSLRTFWAIISHKLVDWIEDFAFLGLFIAAVLYTKKGERVRRCAELLFVILLSATTILIINRFLCRDILSLRRESPSRMLPSAISLADYFSWAGIKTESNKSFPGDHATLALLLSMGFAHFVRGRLALIAVCLGLLLCVPRLATGPHWLSDVVVGSGSIVLFSLSIAFFTPLASICTSKLQRGIELLLPKKDENHD